MHELVVRTVRALRLGRQAEAGAEMVKLLDQLSAALAKGALDPAATVAILRDVLEAQARGDDLGVADELEYRLLPLLMGAE